MPRSAKAAARFTVVVVLPLPPLLFASAIVRTQRSPLTCRISPSKKPSAANVTRGGACSSESGAVSPSLRRRRIAGDPSAGRASGSGDRSASKAGGAAPRMCAHRHEWPGPQGSETQREERSARALERISVLCLVLLVWLVARLPGPMCLAASPAMRHESRFRAPTRRGAGEGRSERHIHARAPARIDRPSLSDLELRVVRRPCPSASSGNQPREESPGPSKQSPRLPAGEPSHAVTWDAGPGRLRVKALRCGRWSTE